MKLQLGSDSESLGIYFNINYGLGNCFKNRISLEKESYYFTQNKKSVHSASFIENFKS